MWRWKKWKTIEDYCGQQHFDPSHGRKRRKLSTVGWAFAYFRRVNRHSKRLECKNNSEGNEVELNQHANVLLINENLCFILITWEQRREKVSFSMLKIEVFFMIAEPTEPAIFAIFLHSFYLLILWPPLTQGYLHFGALSLYARWGVIKTRRRNEITTKFSKSEILSRENVYDFEWWVFKCCEFAFFPHHSRSFPLRCSHNSSTLRSAITFNSYYIRCWSL